MIEYVQIINPTTRQLVAIVDSFKSVIWKSVYYGVGQFEIYAPATEKNLLYLRSGYFVTVPNNINCGIIDTVQITNSEQDGKMIVASGSFAKKILSQRIIYRFVSTYSVTAATLSGNVAEACWKLINDNCGTSAPSYRRFSSFGRGAVNNLPATIVDDNGAAATKQVTYDNLLDYTDALLQEYDYGAYVWLDMFSGDLLYVMYAGADRSVDNKDGNDALIFSTEFDNLLSSEYSYTSTEYRTTAIIGGQGEALERFVSRVGDSAAGYNRRELWVDANGVSRTVKNADDEEITYTDAEYNTILVSQGKNALSEHTRLESFTGEIDLSNSKYVYGNDYSVGDIITIEDQEINRRANCRILSITEVQDENGYNISAEYETIGGVTA